MSKTCNVVLAGVATLALLLAGAVCGTLGGAAVAKGKIKANQIAKGAIRTKHLKTGAVTGDRLAAGAVTGDKLAAGAVTGDKLAAGAVTGNKLATNTLTGAQVDEATLGRVPDAAAIAGAAVTHVARRMLSTNGAPVTIATGPEWTLAVDCSPTDVLLVLTKTGNASLVATTWTSPGNSPLQSSETFGLVQQFGDAATFDYELSSLAATGTATTRVELSASRAPNAFGGGADCFFMGTVTTKP